MSNLHPLFASILAAHGLGAYPADPKQQEEHIKRRERIRDEFAEGLDGVGDDDERDDEDEDGEEA